MTSANDFLIALRKTLKILFISKILNFFCLFMIFRISFLIICESDFTTCSYLKSFMLFKFVCDFSEKKLCHSISAFFCIIRTAHHLKQLLNYDVVSEQYKDLTWSWKSSESDSFETITCSWASSELDSFETVTWSWASLRLDLALTLIAVWEQQQSLMLPVCSYREKTIDDSEDRWLFFLAQHASFHMFCFSVAASCMFLQNWAVLTLWMIFLLTWFRVWIFLMRACWWWVT